MKTKSEKVKKAKMPTITGTTNKVSTSKLEGLVKKKSEEEPKSEKGDKKKKKRTSEKKDRTASSRATNYNFPKDCTEAKDRKKFRTTVRKKMGDFQDRLADAKTGKSKESEKTVLKELNAYKAEVYLTTKEAAE